MIDDFGGVAFDYKLFRVDGSRVLLPSGAQRTRAYLMFAILNPSTYLFHVVEEGFSKRTRPRAERAGGQPLGRSTTGFLHLKALEPPYNRPREAPLKIRRARTPRL
jgi:hypothetical protein